MSKKASPAHLQEPIKLTRESIKEQAVELHLERLAKMQSLLDLYEVPDELRVDAAQQWYWLAVCLAKEKFPGLKVKGTRGRRGESRSGRPAWKFFAEIRRLMARDDLKLDKAIGAIIVQTVNTQTAHLEILALSDDPTDDVPAPALPESLSGYTVSELLSDEGQEAAYETLRARYYEAQRDLKKKLGLSNSEEKRQVHAGGPHHHGASSREVCTADPCIVSADRFFDDAASHLIWKLERDPEFFELADLEKLYADLIAHAILSAYPAKCGNSP